MMPETIILDVADVMKKFHETAATSDHYSYSPHMPFFIQEMTNRVVDCLRDRRMASHKLHSLVQEISFGRYVHPTAGHVPAEFAPLVLELGHGVLAQLDEYKVYDLQGRLPYHFWVPPFKVDPGELLLQRTEGLAK